MPRAAPLWPPTRESPALALAAPSAPVVVVAVQGQPRPAGSKRVLHVGPSRRPVVVDTAGHAGRRWRRAVQRACAAAFPHAPLEGPLAVAFTFTLPRPATHVGRLGTLRPRAPTYPATRPDVTKLVRAAEDAATGFLWRDDAQVVVQTASKRYGPVPGVAIVCHRLLEVHVGRASVGRRR